MADTKKPMADTKNPADDRAALEGGAALGTTLATTIGLGGTYLATMELGAGSVSSHIASHAIIFAPEVTLPIVAGLAVGVTTALAIDVSLAWSDNKKLLDGIKPDLQAHGNLRMLEKQMHVQLDAAGITKNSQGEYDLTNAANADKMNKLMLARKAELEKTIKDNSTYRPTWLDMTNGQRESRSREFLAQDALKRLTAAGVELGDQLHANAEVLKQEVAKASAHEAELHKHHIKGGHDAKHAQAPAAHKVPAKKETQTLQS
jgi:hypothetical protein